MIRGIGVLRISTYSQTLNVQTNHALAHCKAGKTKIKAPSGPSSVSGAGDAE